MLRWGAAVDCLENGMVLVMKKMNSRYTPAVDEGIHREVGVEMREPGPLGSSRIPADGQRPCEDVPGASSIMSRDISYLRMLGLLALS
ncbi:uncharacterized protein N7477_001619 [Penicillium maclennaniae]|uniref:uncharacterized protein n=1 Tax=Penicillium maclennaniae TaxID=1343394 RepID=UPI0025409FE6|nr:uncharacterized protein N7477_001619 [Penicillium maclennaniae]KAJ5681679.1 hypothetical protein N7477_001619 [Penicillium maclennaniae]